MGFYIYAPDFSLMISAVVLGTFALGLRFFDMDTVRTVVFTAFVVQEFMRLWFIRRQGHQEPYAGRSARGILS